ncbi:MAG: hypothetical protein IT431_03970 [Phycisphaerales bacterium]|nr:hypothetical protein [Phycisphaerales bacterium]
MATGRRTRVRAWLRKWVANPVASVVLAGVLVGDLFTLPRVWNPTTVGYFVDSTVLGHAMTTRSRPFHEVFVVQDGGQTRVIDPETESWDELSGYFAEDGPPIAQCLFYDSSRGEGFWSYVSETSSRGIHVQPLGGNWTPESIALARAALFGEETKRLPCWEWVRTYEDVAAVNRSSTRLLWSGVAHDGFAVTALVALVYSFTGWPAWFATHRLSRRSRRLARGQCPCCGYDLRGIEAGLCPECGRPLNPESPPAHP